MFLVPLVLVLLIGGGIFYWLQLTSNQGAGGLDLIALLKGSSGANDAGGVSSTQGTTAQGTTAQGTTAQGTTAQVPSGAVNIDNAVGSGPETTVAAAVVDSTSIQEGLEPALSEVLDIDPPVAGDLTPVEPEPVVVEEPEVQPVVEEPLPSSEELLASGRAQIQSALDDVGLSQGSLNEDTVSFVRTRSQPKINPGVQAGYGAFRAGNYAEAELSYRRALNEEPTNRDALLGLAAIAVHKQIWPAAAEIYTQLLRIDPRDSVAQTALIAMQANVNSPENESRIKLMLEREPNAHHLYFSLGNLYASQTRWSEAQNAYFNAYSLDSQNADYAYNLAVGLDHMAQTSAAAKYYHRALQLRGSGGGGFDTRVVARRIQSIDGSASQ